MSFLKYRKADYVHLLALKFLWNDFAGANCDPTKKDNELKEDLKDLNYIAKRYKKVKERLGFGFAYENPYLMDLKTYKELVKFNSEW
jgi:hypothetical protein